MKTPQTSDLSGKLSWASNFRFLARVRENLNDSDNNKGKILGVMLWYNNKYIFGLCSQVPDTRASKTFSVFWGFGEKRLLLFIISQIQPTWVHTNEVTLLRPPDCLGRGPGCQRNHPCDERGGTFSPSPGPQEEATGREAGGWVNHQWPLI